MLPVVVLLDPVVWKVDLMCPSFDAKMCKCRECSSTLLPKDLDV